MFKQISVVALLALIQLFASIDCQTCSINVYAGPIEAQLSLNSTTPACNITITKYNLSISLIQFNFDFCFLFLYIFINKKALNTSSAH